MKKVVSILIAMGVFVLSVSAAHIRGGELYYKYVGAGSLPNSSKYVVTLKLYIDCGQNDPGQLDTQAPITIFSRKDNLRYSDVRIADMVNEQFIRYEPNSNPCITNPPTDVCYRLRYYATTIELPDSPDGYTISYQRCCRIENIQNIKPPSDDFGATYLCTIPGTSALPDAVKNSSPLFNTNDAVAICIGSNFEFDFSAVDPDGTDSLVYRLCDAYKGGGPGNGRNCVNCPTPNPAAPPPYTSIPYKAPYSGGQPLGNAININPKTGLISGVAPNTIGQYVVTTCVDEYRRGVLINTHRKDIHIKVSDCIPLRARLKPDYAYCDDFLVTFKNQQVNPTGSVYIWDFGDNSSDTSLDIEGTIQHQYADTGTYRIQVKVVLAGQCVDSTSAKARVYPGFYPGFTFDGSCRFSPFNFSDTTRSRYGAAAYWSWDFGDETTESDTSHDKNPSYLYNSFGNKDVKLIVQTDKGCIDTIYHTTEVTDKPDLQVPFKDTLICSVDSLRLEAKGRGDFSWAPAANMLFSHSGSPVVYPKTTTTYTVSLFDNGCISSENIRVRVVDSVTLSAGEDTTICTTDSIRFSPRGDGLQYNWSADPAATNIVDPGIRNAVSIPSEALTSYHVIAKIGKCFKEDDIVVKTIDYPIANAGADTIICFKDTAGLNARIVGSSFRWDPVSTLSNGNILNPRAFPVSTKTYTLLAFDTLGCPKPGKDQVLITVRPKINAFAGPDTAVVKDQPLQLNGTGAEFFEWTPATGLNLATINNPVATLRESVHYVMRAYTMEGCFSRDTVFVQVFQTIPDIFVPNAFVPNGRNNTLRPRPVGISVLDYFRVYNRWGQLVFQTNQLGHGWDGRINGVLQNNGTYVWMISGIDYTGKKVLKKGTATLIR